jgi:enoyl-CoA hydratase/carnithine racemase
VNPLQVSVEDGLALLELGEDFRFSPESLRVLADQLDAVTERDDVNALVTAASGKTWASGLDLDWLKVHPDEIGRCSAALHQLYARMLELPVLTVAAIQGHAFAAGAMFALAHDYRVMRVDRGYFCLPEVDLGIRFTPGLARFLRLRLPQPACHQAVVLGMQYGGGAAQQAGIVDLAVDGDEVLPAARAAASRLGEKPGKTVAEIRGTLYRDVITHLRDEHLNEVQRDDFEFAFAHR